ncbi:MAG: class II aldolase/adducin family protein [Planctomycetota bacterium]|nr:class II aldolase/adducin family protein [Planctomycetota bacterium]
MCDTAFQSASPPAAVAEAMGHIYRRGMTTTSGGNISMCDERGAIWITPSQVDKGRLSAADIACVKPDGRIEGRHPPSSEFPSHRQIYRARPDVRSIVHAHPAGLVAFSICHEVPDTAVLPDVRDLCGEVGYAPYEKSGSEALGERIAAVFAEGRDCVLLENHGIVVGGPDLDLAVRRFEAIELTARMLIRAKALGEVRAPARPADSSTAPEQIEDQPPRGREASIARELCDFAHRIWRQTLTISGGGACSARLDDGAFIISRRGADWRLMTEDDLLRVDPPERAAPAAGGPVAAVHGAIYRRHPEVGAIIAATPPHATAFAVTGSPLDSHIMFESRLFLRDVVQMVGDGTEGGSEEIAGLVGPDRPAALLARAGVLVLGASIFEAFDRLEVLEATAAATLGARGVGRIIPLADGMMDGLPGGRDPGR